MSCIGLRCIQGARCSLDIQSILCHSGARRANGRKWQSTQAQSNSHPSSTNPFPLPTSQTASPYDIFHLNRSSTPAEIKARYYELVKLTHPDRILAQSSSEGSSSSAKSDTNQITPEKANEDFKRVREAYTILGNERKRQLYDRSGLGWDPVKHSGTDVAGFGPPVWKGGFPKTDQERREYEEWSSSLRRGAPGTMNRQGWEFRGQSRGHDRHGWQQYAGDSRNLGSDWFYGFGHARDYANSSRQPTYTTNSRFFITLTFLTTVLTLGQYMRLREERKVVVELADRRHQSAAKSLDEARHFARSDAGRIRFDEMKKRAREKTQQVEGKENETEPVWSSVGHGGPNGREAYEQRMKRLGWKSEEAV